MTTEFRKYPTHLWSPEVVAVLIIVLAFVIAGFIWALA